MPASAEPSPGASGGADWVILSPPLALSLFTLALVGAAIVAFASILAVRSWRLSVLGLLLFIPVSGIPILLTYPDSDLAVLLKDFLFVIPAYIGFAVYALRTRARIVPEGTPMALMVMLGVLVLAQALNPAVPSDLVAVIGLKVWLLYVPLYVLGYHLVRTRRELWSVLGLVSLSAVPAVALGVAEALLFRAGEAKLVYDLYGDAAAAATHNLEQLILPSGAVLRRVPSTFSSWTQYYGFILAIVALTYAWWRGSALSGRGRWLAGGLWTLAVAAAFLSGARSAFVFVPIMLVVMLALERTRGRLGLQRLLAPAAALGLSVALLGLSGGDIVEQTLTKLELEVRVTFLERFRQAVELTWTGLGTGVDTIASRYAFSRPDQFPGVNGTWYESWYVKVVLELGVVGLVLVLALFATILWRGGRSHLRLRDPGLRVASAAILAFLVVQMIAATGKPYLDYDPVNVYFWLLAGLLLRLPTLEREEPVVEVTKPEPALAGIRS